MRRLAALVLLLGTLACAEETGTPPLQWTVILATDAHVPGFADRLLVEAGGCVTDVRACDRTTTRTFALGETSWPLSFGMIATDPAGAPLRARLFRADRTLGGVLDPTWSIDVLAQLPPIDAPMAVAMTLTMDCVGVASDPNSGLTCDPASRSLHPSPVLPSAGAETALPRPGSWRSEPCPADPPPSMVCIPGGSFVLGEHHIPATCSVRPRPEPERLLTISPFFIDADEFTVGELRQLILQGRVSREPGVPVSELYSGCTYRGRTVPDADPLPANCLPYEMAKEACLALDKRLPTEAEWEYVASNMGRETPYPWGFDDDACTYAVIGRGPLDDAIADHSCTTLAGHQPGLVPGGSEADRNDLGVRNLGGSVSEIVEDYFADYADPCWSRLPFAAADPICEIPADILQIAMSARGGNFVYPPTDAQVHIRSLTYPGGDDSFLWPDYDGFRCAKSIAGSE